MNEGDIYYRETFPATPFNITRHASALFAMMGEHRAGMYYVQEWPKLVVAPLDSDGGILATLTARMVYLGSVGENTWAHPRHEYNLGGVDTLELTRNKGEVSWGRGVLPRRWKGVLRRAHAAMWEIANVKICGKRP